MKNISNYFVILFLLLGFNSLYAQVGIGTIKPEGSAILDLVSKSKGLLMPRLTTVERDEIALPAKGLMIYNNTVNDAQLNDGTPEAPHWVGVKAQATTVSKITSVTEGNDVSTKSKVCELIPEMTISPSAGNYLVLFNALISSNQTFSSDQGVIDMKAIYRVLKDFPGGVTHALTFGSGETLDPGVYDVVGAPSIDGTLTLDGKNNPNSVFIIRGTGAFTTGAGTNVVLINQANPNNIFWVSEAAMSTGASTIMKGNLVSHTAAIALGANTQLTGSMFSMLGALTMGAGSEVTVPTGASVVDYGVLRSFAMFTSAGGVSGCPTCTITGDVGTGAGAATDFGGIIGNVFPSGTSSVPNTSTYTIWKNNVAGVGAASVPFTSRTIVVSSLVSLQALVNVEEGETIEIRWRVTEGEATLHNRVMSIIPSL